MVGQYTNDIAVPTPLLGNAMHEKQTGPFLMSVLGLLGSLLLASHSSPCLCNAPHVFLRHTELAMCISCWSADRLSEDAADCAGSSQPPAEPALRRRSWSLQGPASILVPNVAPASLGMSPPTVVVGASSAATRAASQDLGAFRRLSIRSGQTEGEEVGHGPTCDPPCVLSTPDSHLSG